MIRYACLLCAAALLAACASVPVTVQSKLPHGSRVGVIMFRDCMIQGQTDCDDSGITAGTIFAHVLSEGSDITAIPLSRPVGAKTILTDQAAVAYAKARGLEYVLNGDVEDYYRVAPFTFRAERAGVSVRLLRSSDGSVMAFFSDRGQANNLSTPDAILTKMAEKFRSAITGTE
jgi:hypothetical protein